MGKQADRGQVTGIRSAACEQRGQSLKAGGLALNPMNLDLMLSGPQAEELTFPRSGAFELISYSFNKYTQLPVH